jgi:hypothetical protein
MVAMDLGAEIATATCYEPPPPRDKLPTLPEDLSEYAWIHTGPPSLSDDPMAAYWERDPFPSKPPEAFEHAGTLDELLAGSLVDLWHSDVPYVVADAPAVLDEREARILARMDGNATVGDLTGSSGMPVADVLGLISELCSRGVVTLDRSGRLPRPRPRT